MRSSDQRYFQVRRTKREANPHLEVADALAMAREDIKTAPVLYTLVRRSAPEFTHVMLACGRTANDFRRNFRRGPARHNVIPAKDIAPHAALLTEKLDGYTCIRLNREQYWNLKTRCGKVKPQDAVVHDPQGQWWSLLCYFMLRGPQADNLGLLTDLRGMAVRLFDPESKADIAKHVTKAIERHERWMARAIPAYPEKASEIYRRVFLSAQAALARWVELEWEAKGIPLLQAQIRVEMEKALVILEAYAAGGDVKRAALDPDTRGRHCSDATLRKRIAKFVDCRYV